MATLIGLMLKQPISYVLPTPEVIQGLIDRTEALLRELHEAILRPAREQFNAAITSPSTVRLIQGPVLRESMFYGPDSAYDFQYRDLAVRKYGRDDEWLKANRGISLQAVGAILRGIQKVHRDKITATLNEMRRAHPDTWSVLPAHFLTAVEVADASGVPLPAVEAFLQAFAVDPEKRNEQFQSLHDFNVATACPLLRAGADQFVLLDGYSLTEAVYESPFYWMTADPAYRDTAMRNRGTFTEEFCRERLERVFGRENVQSDVRVLEGKGSTVSDIDVLVTFGNRAIVLQAKSKRLTLEARKGNDGRIRDDFKKSVQDSYDQALRCARAMQAPGIKLQDSESRAVRLPPDLKEVFILCVVSDHYPALSVQAREFLSYLNEGAIKPPFVLDVFALDAITEMLNSPLRFLSYVGRRVTFGDRLFVTHEMMALAYHLKKNLWVDDEVSGIWLDDSLSVDLDVAMAVRRNGEPGARTPDGVLTRFESTTVGHIIRQIEAVPHPGPLELGFLLLMLGEDAVLSLNKALDHLMQQSAEHHRGHDITITLDKLSSGLTIHCNDDPAPAAQRRLAEHCTLRKYAQRAKTWSGICLRPSGAAIRFGVALDFPWSPNPSMEVAVQHLKKSPTPMAEAMQMIERKRIGANERCPCSSGLKYKKCHGK